MKTSNTATVAAVVLFLQLMTSIAIGPIHAALSQTSITESVTEYYSTCDDDDEYDDDSEPETVVQDETIDQIEKIWSSLLITDHTVDTFDWNSVSLAENYTAESEIIINQTEAVYKQRLLIGSVFNPRVKFLYWNSVLGNKKSIKIKPHSLNEMAKNWLPDKPLKVITHGYLVSQKHDRGVFSIKKAYVDVGIYNVITVDWSKKSKTMLYPVAAAWTKPVGKEIAKLLENIVQINLIKPCDIHVIGHSLGAQVAGVCGDSFRLGKIGRITGLDPAGPAFKGQLVHLRPLNNKDAEFVDVIHTDMTLYGYPRSLGSVDFYPNSGYDQPGCFTHVCSHLRSYKYYTESVYNNNSFVSVKCGSWKEFKTGACKCNEKNQMGHNADPKMCGDFYLATFSSSPYSMERI